MIGQDERLHRVVMPLARVLAEDGIPWADRELIADAILATWRQWRDMRTERQKWLASCASHNK